MKSGTKNVHPARSVPLRVKLLPFLQCGKGISRQSLRADLFAGLTGAFIVMPQGVSFAMIAPHVTMGEMYMTMDIDLENA